MSATTVPIPPVNRGSLWALWGGLGALALAAGGLAWWSTRGYAPPSDCGSKAWDAKAASPRVIGHGVLFQTVKAGTGTKPTDADVALLSYTGRLAKTYETFDSNQMVPFPVQGTVPGFADAMKEMQGGGSYRICIPGRLAYGERGAPDGRIPPNATLLFEVQMMAHMPAAEFQARMQAMQGAQGGPPGGPGGPGGPGAVDPGAAPAPPQSAPGPEAPPAPHP